VTAAAVVREIWHRAVGVQPAPSSSVVAVTAVCAVLLVVIPQVWQYSRHLVTITHEAAHGVAALASGRRLSGIRLHSDTSGLTVSRGRASGLGMIVTSAAGYVGPGVVGLGAAYVVSTGHAVGVLWLTLLLLTVLLLEIRNWFGLWLILLAGIGVFAVSWWGDSRVQSGVSYVGTWFLLVAGPRPVLELQAARRRGIAPNSDADSLARLTRIPGVIWVGVFLLVTTVTLAIGARWLIDSAA